MAIKIALAGNPNSGKTTLFNALTGANQFVGNWPGVTVEKKEGKLKGHKDVIIQDLPGIYSLSPYTLEEVVARTYLISERPDVILNIVDGTNLERNLYLTTQLMELGIPVVMAVNMIDIVNRRGDIVRLDELSKKLGCEAVAISALKGTGVTEAAEKAVAMAKNKKNTPPVHKFSRQTEECLDKIAAMLDKNIPETEKRFYAIKVFERDDKIKDQLKSVPDAESIIAAAEKAMDCDSESIITNERYDYITGIIKNCYTKKSKEKLSISDKIDRVLTHRILALPIFAAIMFVVYYVSVTTVGTVFTDWANDGLFGDGWYLFGIGRGEYEEAAGPYGDSMTMIDGYIAKLSGEGVDTEAVETALDSEAEDYDPENAQTVLTSFIADNPCLEDFEYEVENEETLEVTVETASAEDLDESVAVLSKNSFEEPDPANYGVWVPGIPVLVENALDSVGCVDWLKGLILDGIIAGVGAVIGFVPQMLVLFIFLAFLEGCGYMARIAFILDRIFRRFGLSGKSFIPLLIGSGCGIPGVMASRTIESERDRRMTVMTTTFIPCGAKLPFIAMIAGAIFGGNPWIAPSAYFVGIAAVVCSGIILKKTKMFAGDPAPFVMELPAYHWPTVGYVLRSMWERGWSFIKKAGTVILLSTIVIWFLSFFGFVDGAFVMLAEDQLDSSILAYIGRAIAWIFTPLGFGNWQATVASVTGLVAKENIVGTMGILYKAGGGSTWQNLAAAFTGVTGYAFLVFNLLCAPCFAALGAIRREMNSHKWFWFAFGYQMIFAYLVALCINQLGGLFTGAGFGVGTVVAVIVVILFVYLLVRPYRESQTLKSGKVKVR